MITVVEEVYILNKAYVPEHIAGLMIAISRAEPFLIRDCLCYAKDDCLIVIGYPLDGKFSPDNLKALLQEAELKFKPESIRIAAPQIPAEYLKSCSESEHDEYYRLDVDMFSVKRRLMREVDKAMENLTVEKTGEITKEHKTLIEEFIKRENPPSRIKELYLSIPGYTAESKTAVLLNARDKKGRLSAFYVLELAAYDFVAYVVGCHSKKRYAPHASDLLLYETIKLAQECGKSHINLGLGVNEGIRRFKEKWGGTPYLEYTFCEYSTVHENISGLIKSLGSIL